MIIYELRRPSGLVVVVSTTSRPSQLRPSRAFSVRRFYSFSPTAKTDGCSTYPGAPGIAHDWHAIGKIAASVVLPWINRIFVNLKVWALSIYHGLRSRRLQFYLDEFVFRFSRCRTRHAVFQALLGIAVGHAPLTYKMPSHREQSQ